MSVTSRFFQGLNSNTFISNKSVLDSAKKPGTSAKDVFSDPHLKSIAAAMELVPVKQYFCRLLAGTYGGVAAA